MRTFIALLLVVSSLAFAQTEQPAKLRPPKTQNIDFTGQQLTAERAMPTGSYGLSKRRSVFKSLIKERRDFNDKLANSVDAL